MKKTAILLIAPFLLSGCIFRGCHEEISAEAVSPDGTVTAALIERGCGATTPFVAHVNLRPSDSQFSKDEDGVIKDWQVFISKGRTTGIKLVWEGPKKLVIECSDCEPNPRINDNNFWQDITISFRNTQAARPN